MVPPGGCAAMESSPDVTVGPNPDLVVRIYGVACLSCGKIEPTLTTKGGVPLPSFLRVLAKIATAHPRGHAVFKGPHRTADYLPQGILCTCGKEFSSPKFHEHVEAENKAREEKKVVTR